MNEYTKKFIDNLIKLQLTSDKIKDVVLTKIQLLSLVDLNKINNFDELLKEIDNFLEKNNINPNILNSTTELDIESAINKIGKLFKIEKSDRVINLLIEDYKLHDNKVLYKSLKFGGLFKILKNIEIIEKINIDSEFKDYYENALNNELCLKYKTLNGKLQEKYIEFLEKKGISKEIIEFVEKQIENKTYKNFPSINELKNEFESNKNIKNLCFNLNI